MKPDRNDPAVRAFIWASCAATFSQMAGSILATFGPERAWPIDWIAATYRELHPPRRGGKLLRYRDAELIAFIADRADLVSIQKMVELGRAHFGEGRFPSKSELHRMIVKIRAWQAVAAKQA